MANTGIILRRNVKSHFQKMDFRPAVGEIVFATDTFELGTQDQKGNLIWRPFMGFIESIQGRTGHVTITTEDLGLDKVDNTPDKFKPVSMYQKDYIDDHTKNTLNPHKTTKEQIGLSQVDNTSDWDKPVSRLQKEALDRKANIADLPDFSKFVQIPYQIRDGQLSEFNFNLKYKTLLDNIFYNKQLLSDTEALTIEGSVIRLKKADGSVDVIEVPVYFYDDTEIKDQINLLSESVKPAKDLYSKEGVLHASVGTEILDRIDDVKTLITTNKDNITRVNELIKQLDAAQMTISPAIISKVQEMLSDIESSLVNKIENTTPDNAMHIGGIGLDELVLMSDFRTRNREIDSEIKITRDILDTKVADEQLRSEVNKINTEIRNIATALENFATNDLITSILTDIENLKNNPSSNNMISDEIAIKIDMLDNVLTEVENLRIIVQSLQSDNSVTEINETINSIQSTIQEMNTKVIEAEKQLSILQDSISKVNNLESRINNHESSINQLYGQASVLTQQAFSNLHTTEFIQ